MSAAVRFLLSVAASTIRRLRRARIPVDNLLHRLRAQLAGSFLDSAVDVVVRHALGSGGLNCGAQPRIRGGIAPPSFAATVISLESFEKSLPRLASKAPLKRFTFDHLLWPAMRMYNCETPYCSR